MAYFRGDYWMACELCGGRYRRSSMRKNWKGQMVCPDDFEERHPQEFVRGRIDTIAVPVSRPWGEDNFLVRSITSPDGIEDPQLLIGQDAAEAYNAGIVADAATGENVMDDETGELVIDADV